jgi:hypothetical protein
LYAFLVSPMDATWPVHLILLDLIIIIIIIIISEEVYRLWSSAFCSFRYWPLNHFNIGPHILWDCEISSF